MALLALMILVEIGAGLISGNALRNHHGAALGVDYLIAWPYWLSLRGRLRRGGTQDAHAWIRRSQGLDLGGAARAWVSRRASRARTSRLGALERAGGRGTLTATRALSCATGSRGANDRAHRLVSLWAQVATGITYHWLIVQDA